MRFLAQCSTLGTARAYDLLRECDPDALLALRATNAAAMEFMDEQYKRLAQHIAVEVSKVFGG